MALISCSVVLMATSAALVPAHPVTTVDGLQMTKAGYTPQQVESYLSAEQLTYIRPGFKIKMVKLADVAPGKKPVVEVTYTDDLDQPLDYAGKATPGALTISFILSWYDPVARQYTAYTLRTRSGVTNPAADQNGQWVHSEMGHSTYTFNTVLPATMDVTKTHTLGIYGRRNLTDILGKNYNAPNINHDFRPDGKAVTDQWDAMAVENSCNLCHDPLGLHGGTRLTVKNCVLCHTPQVALDPTGSSFDFKVMIHKLHRSKDLPSVVAGGKYILAGGDYSDITYPQDIRNCTTCHTAKKADGKTDNPEAHIWFDRLSRKACGSCHDDINWTTGANHAAGPQADDKACASCHLPEGEQEFDISVMGAHTKPTVSTQLKGLKMEIVSVKDTAPGSKPTVTFKVTTKSGTVVNPTTLSSCNFILGGSTTEYTRYFREACNKNVTMQGDTASLTFTTAIPADATGTWTLSADYYNSVKLNPAPKNAAEATVRDAGFNPIFNIAITGDKVEARRSVVKLDQCNKCHDTLALHGGQRYRIEECIICHNPNETDKTRRPADKLPAESVNMKYMIHRIHTGEELKRDYTVYGFFTPPNPPNPVNFNEVTYPGDRRNCQACHLAKTYFVPTPEGSLPTVTAKDWYSPMLPDAASCLSCHSTRDAAAHAFVNTAPFGESCASCHGDGREFSVEKVHAR